MNEPIQIRPLNSGEKLLRQKFAEQKAGQSDLMDSLAKQLITLELAILGLYATVLTTGEARGGVAVCSTVGAMQSATAPAAARYLASDCLARLPMTPRIAPTEIGWIITEYEHIKTKSTVNSSA